MSQQARRTIPGVLFIEDFDDHPLNARSSPVSSARDVEPEPARPAAPAEQLVTQAQLETLCASARDDGFAAGYAAAEQQLTSERLSTLRKIDDALSTLAETMEQAIHRDLELVADIALSLLVDSVPVFCERYGAEEMRVALRSILSSVIDEPGLAIVVPTDLVGVVQHELSSVGGRALQIPVTPCSTMKPGDLRLTWEQGSARRSAHELRDLMRRHLSELGFLHSMRKDHSA